MSNPYLLDQGVHLQDAYQKGVEEGKVMPHLPFAGWDKNYGDLVYLELLRGYAYHHDELYKEAAEKYPGIGNEQRSKGMEVYFGIHHYRPVISGYNPESQELDMIIPVYRGKEWEALAGKKYLSCRLPKDTVKELIETEIEFNLQHLDKFAHDADYIRHGETLALAVDARAALEQSRDVYEQITGDRIKDARRELKEQASQYATNNIAVDFFMNEDGLTGGEPVDGSTINLQGLEKIPLKDQAAIICQIVNHQAQIPLYDGGLAKRNLNN
jgi:hypothetical protein